MSHATVRATDAAIQVTFLTAPDCHLCDRGRRVLAELGSDHRLSVREVDVHSRDGRELAVRARVPFPPAVVVHGRLLAHGRLSTRRLARQLAALDASGVPTSDRAG